MRGIAIIPLIAGLSSTAATAIEHQPALGIGSIVFKQDGSSAAFELDDYLKARPLAFDAAVVDYVTDADFHVSGTITGTVEYQYSCSEDDFPASWGHWPITLPGMGIVMGGAFLGVGIATLDDPYDTDHTGQTFAIVGASVLGPSLLALGTYITASTIVTSSCHRVKSALGGEFVVRRAGRKVATLTIPPIVYEKAAHEADASFIDRRELFEPVFRELAARIRDQMNAPSPVTTPAGAR